MLSFTDPAVSVVDADAYAILRAWAEWVGPDQVKAGAIRRAQDYIAGIGNGRWANEWHNDDAPAEVKYAIIEAARRELVSPGSLNPDFIASKVLRRERKKVGPLEKELEYSEASKASAVRPDIAIIDQLLAGLLRPAGGASVDILRV
ncbi:DnaT-like ssDNA-binding protein [Paradevosia shaoguanensis]|uniref:DnaT-like ssDNA-binding protein n=1 Tax=Paradevosia shaoguanensis TaxID=1335043 RepID=UPI001933FB05|nr:DnaT-like ssDNA-binding protein [Paradevosia shaoguanensis]